MTFCQDWCRNFNCDRNQKHIIEAQKEGGFLDKNPWMPVCYFVEPPVDCNERIKP